MDVDERFYPYRTTPLRLARDAAAAIAATDGIARVGVIGALAGDRHDGLTSIDLLVALETPDGPVSAAAALHEALPIRYYHASPDAAPPSGAYWLLGEAPFHRIEIEFAGPADYAAAVSAAAVARTELLGPSSPPLVMEIDSMPSGPAPPARAMPDVLVRPAPEQARLGEALTRSLDQMAEYLRGRVDIEPVRTAAAALDGAYEAAGKPANVAQGDLGALVAEVRELWHVLHLAHVRAESGIEIRDSQGLSG